jgi:hypothetical protein
MNVNIPDDVIQYLSQFTFRGNSKLRPEGTRIEYTEEMIDELKKCMNDPIYFIKNYIYVVHPDRGVVKFDLFPYQERMINAYHNNRQVIFLTARQQGKCLSINTNVRIRQKSSGQIFEITLGDFYAWQKTFEGIDLSVLQEELHRLNSKEETKVIN